MKNNYKLICGTLAGLLLGGLSIVGANEAIQAIQNTEIKVMLNGKLQEFKDETTGEAQYPITYHDRTYLPLRNVAQLAGLNVEYNSDSNTAILTNNPVDEATGLVFRSHFEDMWKQIVGFNLYYCKAKRIFELSSDLFDGDDIDPTIKELFEGMDTKTWETEKHILGIAPLYLIDEDDLENSPMVTHIVIKYEDNTYGAIKLGKNSQVGSINTKEVKELNSKYLALKEKYGF